MVRSTSTCRAAAVGHPKMEPPIATQPADHRIPPAEEFYFGTSGDSSLGIDKAGCRPQLKLIAVRTLHREPLL